MSDVYFDIDAEITAGRYRYVGEGNRNLVIALDCRAVVLRLHKRESEADVDQMKELRNIEIDYNNKIMLPIFTEQFLCPKSTVTLSRQSTLTLMANIHDLRPVNRRIKSNVDTEAVMMINYTSNDVIDSDYPTLCAEIKLKQGFMSRTFSDYKICSFCVNQYLKLNDGSIDLRSEYCPLDLFSGDYNRMKKSIEALFANPQNNFKLFVSNNQIKLKESQYERILNDYFKSESNSRDVLINILIKSLLWDRTTIRTVNNQLPDDCILNKVLKIQLLDCGDVLSESDDCGYKYARDLIVKAGERTVIEDSAELSGVQKYMLACTAKDCSVMISMKPIVGRSPTSTDDVVISESGSDFIVKIGVIDLDPKPASKIASHRRRNENALNCYLKSK